MSNWRSAILPCALGVGFLFPAGFLARKTWTFLALSQRAPGRVLPDGRVGHITFETADGRKHKFSTGWNVAFYGHPGQSVEVRYDPGNPTNACVGGFVGLFLEWLPALFFAAIGVLGLAEGILRLAPSRPHPPPESGADAERPWLGRPDWAAGRIESSSDLAGKWIFAIVWNFLVWLGAFLYWRGLPDDSPRSLLANLADLFKDPKNILLVFPLIFAVIAVVSLSKAVTRTYQAVRSGRSLFVMRAVPGVIGGTLDGDIHARLHLGAGQEIRLVLRCHLKSTRRNQGKTTVTTSVKWKDDRVVPATDISQAGDEARIPVQMTIPATCRETAARVSSPGSPPTDYDSISWRLEARTEPGSAWRAEFEVPIFQARVGAP